MAKEQQEQQVCVDGFDMSFCIDVMQGSGITEFYKGMLV